MFYYKKNVRFYALFTSMYNAKLILFRHQFQHPQEEQKLRAREWERVENLLDHTMEVRAWWANYKRDIPKEVEAFVKRAAGLK